MNLCVEMLIFINNILCLFIILNPIQMIKTLTAIAILLAFTSAFNLKREIIAPFVGDEQLNAIPWPYTVCGSGAAWTIDSLTLGQTPKRNLNDDITVV